uniref:Uncharacterized protein n=1 Tax=Anguilla anguilla TaxID=7936 RepID=A0A0E9W7X7_ANGAN
MSRLIHGSLITTCITSRLIQHLNICNIFNTMELFQQFFI